MKNLKMYFIRTYALLFKDTVIMKPGDKLYKEIFYINRKNNADIYSYTCLGRNVYLKTKKQL